jgi:acylpyruvate hydrolase
MAEDVKNLWCVGRNYADHAKELGNAVPTDPIFFLKSGSCVAANTQPIRWPMAVGPVHHEVELAVRFGANLELAQMTVALDFTAREKQNELKKQAYPWTVAKSFTNSALLGPWTMIKDLAALQKQGEIFLTVNGQTVQHGLFSHMIFSVEQLAQYAKTIFPVQPGDVLLTGTPAGVGPLKSGDVIEAWINNEPKTKWLIGDPI